jgi:thiamine-phosphate pyrophosphorylase
MSGMGSEDMAGVEALHGAALALKASAKHSRPELPPLLFFTDPERTPQPWRVAERLPEGCGVVLRAFGRSDAVETGEKLAAVCADRGLVLLVGADCELARELRAQGVHLPERTAAKAGELKQAEPSWLVTAAAHDADALEAAAQAGADAAVLSPVFTSGSPSAGTPLGVERFTALVAAARLPVYALGGVDMKNAPELLGSGACGLAVVSALIRT